ncbi:MAG: DUF11 domain-containing protein [Anaerolineae bacterium]|nr:DUF11 domain-containing protein [Anaerolineae bacterium]
MTETLKLLPPEGEGLQYGHYGRAVLIDDDTLFVAQAPVGVYPDPGTTPGQVFVYGRHVGGPNNWGLTAVITPSDSTPGNGDGFGTALALSGDILVVGAASGDGNAEQSGTAYVFERNAGGDGNWGEVARLVASDGAYWDRFGWTVDIDGDTVVIGARWDDNGNGFDAGAAYVFERNAGGPNNWGQVRKLLASDGDPSDRFGQRVAIAGDIIVVGADGQDTNGSDSGSVYIFERNAGGSNNWGQVAQIYPNPSGTNYQFGMSVDIEEDLLAVGAIQASPNPGAVYLFDRNAGGTNNWGQIAHIVPSDGASGDRFGILLELKVGRLIVGAQYGNGVTVNSGTAYLFERDAISPTQWVEINKLIASDGAANDEFSWGGVSVSGETIAVGSFRNDDFCPSNPNCDSGSAYLFTAVLPSDVAINKAVSGETAVPGQPLTYTLTFTNNGPDMAFGTVITDLVPGSIVNPTFTSSGVTITPTGSVPFVWQVAEMMPGMGGVITVTGIISPELLSETTIVNTAVISNSADITPTNNSSTAVTQIVIPQINLSASEYVVDENGGQVMITAVLSPAQPFLDVTVGYETSDAMAVAGDDYTAVSGSLTFTAGSTEVQVIVPILDDELVEGGETFIMALSDPVHGTMGSLAEATVWILDNDSFPLVSLSSEQYIVPEDVGEAVFTVTLSHDYPEPVSLIYQTADGTAVADEDYTPITATLVMPPGVTAATFTVPIIDNTQVEPSESFFVSLSNFSNATPQPPVTTTVTIVDNDEDPPVPGITIYLPIIVRSGPPPSPVEFRVFIGNAIPARLVTVQGETFYETTIQVPATLPDGGAFYLSTGPDQVAATAVDDQIGFTLPSGDVIFSYRYSDHGEPVVPHIVPVPRALVAAMAGQTVSVRYADVFGFFVSASTVWLIWTP